MAGKRENRASEPERDETPAERLDRNWIELLQELRVAQTGVQILFAFLLVLPFQARFKDIADAWATSLYLVILALITIATVCMLAPVIIHRVLFRQRLKDVLLDVSDRLAIAGFAAMGSALVCAVALVTHVTLGGTSGAVAGGLAAVLALVLWLALPLRLLQKYRDEEEDRY